MKTWKSLTLAAIAFTAGLYLSGPIKGLIPKKQCIAQKGFYKYPYNLKIKYLERNGKTESYLIDKVTKEYWKIEDKTNVKRGKSKLERKLDLLLKFYNLIGF